MPVMGAAAVRIWAECRHGAGLRFEVGPADQVDAVGHRGEHAVERFLDRLGLPRQVDDQAGAAGDAHLARQDGGRHVLQRHCAHRLAEAGQHLVRHRQRRFRGDVARRRAGAAGGQDERTPFAVGSSTVSSRSRLFVGITGDEFAGLASTSPNQALSAGSPVFVASLLARSLMETRPMQRIGSHMSEKRVQEWLNLSEWWHCG